MPQLITKTLLWNSGNVLKYPLKCTKKPPEMYEKTPRPKPPCYTKKNPGEIFSIRQGVL